MKADDGELVAAPMDPYTALKQNYDSLVAFSMKVQNALDSLASVVRPAPLPPAPPIPPYAPC